MITTNYSIQSQEYHPTPAPEGPEGSIWIYMKISMPKWNHCNQASTDTGPVSLPPLKATRRPQMDKKERDKLFFFPVIFV